MKALVYEKYGSPEELQIKEVQTPVPAEHEVLVKVHAASINSWDWDLLRGKPLIVRIIYGAYRRPKYTILGADIAGVVVAIGKKVTKLKVGDAVYGDVNAHGWGGFAEFTCTSENSLVHKSASMSFVEAAATPQAAVMALQSLKDKNPVSPGDKVLLVGAGGGVGSFAIQMAKAFGAEVTAVDSAHKFDFMLSLGADFVIDYTQQDFSTSGKEYDRIIDVVACRSIYDYQRALTPTGKFILVGGKTSTILQTLLLGTMLSKKGGKQLAILAHEPNKNLLEINELFETKKVIPKVDKVYALNDGQEAFRYFESGKFRGKVVLSINEG